MKRALFLTPLILVVISESVCAQPPGRGLAGGPLGRPAYMEKLVLPRLIMRNQAEIGLTDAQREAIGKIMSDGQSKLVELQWRLQSESQKLGQLLEPQPIDEGAALDQASKVMEIEKEAQRNQLAMLIKVRNQLSAEQYAKLITLRPSAPRPRARPQPPGGPMPPPESGARGGPGSAPLDGSPAGDQH